MIPNFTKSLIAAFISVGILSSCSQQKEEMESLQASAVSEFGTHPSTCNVVRSFGYQSSPMFVEEIEDNGARIKVTAQRRGHNGKYLDENKATVFNHYLPFENKTINLLGYPKLVTVGDGSSSTMYEQGGRIIVDFSPMGSVTLKSFLVYDIDDADEGSIVELFSSNGQLLKSKKLPKTDPKDIAFVGFDGDVSGVTKMVVTFGEGRKLAGSGAITMLQLCADGAGRCSQSGGPLKSMWLEYTGDKPANVKVSTKSGSATKVIYSENGMKPGHIIRVESGEGLGEAVLIETNRKESHTINAAAGSVIKKQYGSFKVLDARDDWGGYPLCLQ